MSVPPSGSEPFDDPRALAGLFAVSAALLTLEIVQTKICAFSLDPLRIDLAIGVCMLGLGAAATALAIVPVAGGARARRLAAGCVLAAALRVLQARRASLVAWAIGGNGFASVVGSTVAIPLALLTGLATALSASEPVAVGVRAPLEVRTPA